MTSNLISVLLTLYYRAKSAIYSVTSSVTSNLVSVLFTLYYRAKSAIYCVTSSVTSNLVSVLFKTYFPGYLVCPSQLNSSDQKAWRNALCDSYIITLFRDEVVNIHALYIEVSDVL